MSHVNFISNNEFHKNQLLSYKSKPLLQLRTPFK